ncbi:hypothetical protein [Beijerinckia mobilis]|nr:hypothetical protein [Beijerinckia mobilis]
MTFDDDTPIQQEQLRVLCERARKIEMLLGIIAGLLFAAVARQFGYI